MDGLKGFPETIESVYPNTQIQLCIVHMIRNSVKYVNWKDRKLICQDLKRIYTSATEPQAEGALEEFGKKRTMPIHTWKAALSQFAIKFPGRFE